MRRHDAVDRPSADDPSAGSRTAQEAFSGPEGQLIRPCRTELVSVIRSVVASFCAWVVSVLWFPELVFFRLAKGMLPRVRVEHAPARGKSLFKFYLQRVRDGHVLVTFRTNARHIRDGIEVGPTEVAGAVREVGVQWQRRLVQVAEEGQLHPVRADVCHLQCHVLEQGALYVQIPFFNVWSPVVE